jgi:hypothetical protein
MSGGLQPVNDTRSGRITYTFKDWLEHIPLDSNGFFSIPPKTLLVQPYETKYIMPGMDFSTNYTLQLSDYAEEMDAFVRLGEALNIARPIGTFSNYVPPVVNRMDKVIQLKKALCPQSGDRQERRLCVSGIQRVQLCESPHRRAQTGAWHGVQPKQQRRLVFVQRCWKALFAGS